MPKKVKKVKQQKQKQKQSQQVIVKIDQSRRIVQRKGKEQPPAQQQRLNISPVINLPSYPRELMQQQQAQRELTPTPVAPARIETTAPPAKTVESVRAPSVPDAFTGASQRVGNITELSAPSQFQPERDNSLGAYMRRRQRQPIEAGEAEAAQPQEEEEEDNDEIEYAELPQQTAQDLITPLLEIQQITTSERDYVRSLLTRRRSNKVTQKLREIYNKYISN